MPREMYRYSYTHNYTCTSSLFTMYRILSCPHAHQIFPMLTAPQKNSQDSTAHPSAKGSMKMTTQTKK